MIITNKQISKYIIPAFILLLVDILWINIIMKNPYNRMITLIQSSPMKVNYIYAMLAYISMVIILLFIVIRKNFSLLETFITGLCLYAVYDFTCGAIFNKWNFNLALLDILWGGIVFTLAKYISDII